MDAPEGGCRRCVGARLAGAARSSRGSDGGVSVSEHVAIVAIVALGLCTIMVITFGASKVMERR